MPSRWWRWWASSSSSTSCSLNCRTLLLTHLRAGPLGIALTVSSLLFLTGSLAFVAAMGRTGELSKGPLALYAIGSVPVALRAAVPEAALDLGLVSLAAGV